MKATSLAKMACVFLLVGLPGCVTKYMDCGSTFVVRGVVVDAKDGIPIGGATVAFIDAGLGAGAKTHEHYEIGHSNAEGRIDERIQYRWPAHERFFVRGSMGGPVEVVSKERYRSQRCRVQFGSLPNTAEGRSIELGVVRLQEADLLVE